jgi:hypothetical protein
VDTLGVRIGATLFTCWRAPRWLLEVPVILVGPMLSGMCYWAFVGGRGSRLAAGRRPVPLIVVSAAKADGAAWSDPVGLVGDLVDGGAAGIDQDDGVALVAELERSRGGDLHDPTASDGPVQVVPAASPYPQKVLPS